MSNFREDIAGQMVEIDKTNNDLVCLAEFKNEDFTKSAEKAKDSFLNDLVPIIYNSNIPNAETIADTLGYMFNSLTNDGNNLANVNSQLLKRIAYLTNELKKANGYVFTNPVQQTNPNNGLPTDVFKV